jgi:hypothetical protein
MKTMPVVRYLRASALGPGLLRRQEWLDDGLKFVAYESFCYAGQLGVDGAIPSRLLKYLSDERSLKFSTA